MLTSPTAAPRWTPRCPRPRLRTLASPQARWQQRGDGEGDHDAQIAAGPPPLVGCRPSGGTPRPRQRLLHHRRHLPTSVAITVFTHSQVYAMVGGARVVVLGEERTDVGLAERSPCGEPLGVEDLPGAVELQRPARIHFPLCLHQTRRRRLAAQHQGPGPWLGTEDLPGVLRRCRRCVADGGGGPEAEMIAHHRQGQGPLRADRNRWSSCRGGEIASTPSIRTTADNQCMMRLLPSIWTAGAWGSWRMGPAPGAPEQQEGAACD
nr:uncharacterized protein LOC127334002 [Lolium perenne]XP_051216393.1 uncharacterized protein LOC127334002 [Lolium perenne]